MIFSAKSKFHNPIADALGEPLFVFGLNGGYQGCNARAKSMLTLLGYTEERQPENHESFLNILRLVGTNDSTPFLNIGDGRYEVISHKSDDIFVLRLMPVKEDPHMVRLALAVEIIPWGLITVDLSKQKKPIVYCNKRAEEFFCLPHDAIINQSAYDMLRGFGVSGNMSDYLHSAETSYYDMESKSDNRTLWYRLNFIPFGPRTNACLIVIEDTTENKIMEGQYFQAQRLESLGQLAGGVAHDFNNILSIIDGYARMARKRIDNQSDMLNYLERIAQAVQRGAALTNQLLTFGRHKIVKEGVIDLGMLVKNQEPLLRPLMDASIILEIRTDEKVFVNVPGDNICQILLNICINSRDAMPDGGTLTIEARRKGVKEAVLRVSDTGMGMKPEIKARMFDPFFTTKEQGKGTGLGLSMVYGLVKDMKGEISVLTKEGSGTSISIQFALSEEAPSFSSAPEDEKDISMLKGMTALVAEDEPDLLNILSTTLEDIGVTVLKATNGNDALMLQETYKGKIDFLLTDVVMPNLNGVKLAEIFSSIRPESKVMFISGYPANGVMSRVPIPEGAVIMPKPIDVNKLASVIRDMAASPKTDIKERWKILTGQWKSV